VRASLYKQIKTNNKLVLVREKGLEPPRLTALEPKSSASTNFATLAFFQALNYSAFIENVAYFFKVLRQLRHLAANFAANGGMQLRPLPPKVAESAIIVGYEH
jgi:hypothetical protein